jgi:hypothetical protein
LLGALLYDISATDPLSLGVACAVLLVIGAVAAYLPGHRATKIGRLGHCAGLAPGVPVRVWIWHVAIR